MPPERPQRTIPFYSLTLGDLVQPRGRLVIWCGACRREGFSDVVPMLHRLGPTFQVTQMRSLLVCGNCERKGFAEVRVEYFEGFDR